MWSQKFYLSFDLCHNRKVSVDFLNVMSNHRSIFEKMVDSLTSVVGSWWFLSVHLIWFGGWIGGRRDVEWLTLIVSLEAIILMILLLMSENRRNIFDRRKADQDLSADLSAVKMDKDILRRLMVIEKQISALKPRSDKK